MLVPVAWTSFSREKSEAVAWKRCQSQRRAKVQKVAEGNAKRSADLKCGREQGKATVASLNAEFSLFKASMIISMRSLTDM